MATDPRWHRTPGGFANGPYPDQPGYTTTPPLPANDQQLRAAAEAAVAEYFATTCADGGDCCPDVTRTVATVLSVVRAEVVGERVAAALTNPNGRTT